MVEGLEGIGEVVTGGLAARTVEPGAGEAMSGRSGTCLNCGTELAGEYCHGCGQQGHVHSSLAALWHDLAHGVLHFEGKIWRTLPLLAWRPGELTRRYIAGERARFVSPIALFLFSVFLMFVTYSTLGAPAMRIALPGVAIGPGAEPGPVRRPDFLDLKGIEKMKQERKREEQTRALRAERAQAVAEGRSTEAIDTAIAQKLNYLREDKSRPWMHSLQQKLQANPSLLFYKLQNNAYKFSWALIPISVPFLWLLFAGSRKYRAYHHTVFVTYSITFMSLGAVFLSLLFAAGVPNLFLVLLIALVPPLHIYRQLRGAYLLGRFPAVWRAVLLTVFALVAAALFFAILVLMGVAG
jgi:hypothetical protein